MNFFLKLKHWQIFIIWILGIFQMIVFIQSDFWFISLGIYFALLFDWIYAIGLVLNKNNKNRINKLNFWTLVYLISVIPLGIQYHNMLSNSFERLHPFIFILSSIAGVISIIKIAIISAKSLKEKEKHEELGFKEYFLEFLLILYMVIGIWILQPRLNRIIKEMKNTTDNKAHD